MTLEIIRFRDSLTGVLQNLLVNLFKNNVDA